MKLLKRKLNSRGFSHIELGLLLIVVIGISSVGVYVYKHSTAHAATTYTTLAVIKSDGYKFTEQACITSQSGTSPNYTDTVVALISVNTKAGPSTIQTGRHHQSSGYNPLAYYSINGATPVTEDAWTTASTSTISFDLPPTIGTADFTLGVEGTPGSTSTSAGSTQTLSSVTLCNPPVVAVPTVSLSASPTSINSGSTSTLTWSSTAATSCTATGSWTGSRLTSGTYTTPALTTTSNYSLSCSGAGGTTSANATVTVSTSTTTPTCQTLTIPAYFYPTSTSNPWVTAAAQAPGSIMIADITTSGPGTSVNSDYTSAIADARAAGDTVFGYVDTNYTSVSLATAEANVSSWKNFYNVTNIFFDEVSSTAAQESYYQTLSAYVHAQTAGSLTILNAGDVPAQSYMSAGDIIVTFEGAYSTYQTTTFPSWMSSYGANRFYNIVYDVPTSANMVSVLSQAEKDGIGYIYATNQNLPNPYGALPSYLPAELSAASTNCSL